MARRYLTILIAGVLALAPGANSGKGATAYKTWSISNMDMTVSFTLWQGRPRVEFWTNPRQVRTGSTGVPVPTSPKPVPSSMEAALPDSIDGRAEKLNWRFVGASGGTRKDTSVTFTYRCDEPSLQLVSTWKFAGRNAGGPVEHVVTLRNNSGKTVTFMPPPTMDVSLQQFGDSLEHWWSEKTAGHASELGVHADAITPGYSKALVCGPYSETNSSRDAFPWFCVQDKTLKQVVYGGIEFTGWTQILVRGIDGVTVSMGILPREGNARTRLAPGEERKLPTCFIGMLKGDVDDGANRLHRWVEKYLRPPIPGGVTPLLVNNSWGSGMAVDETLAKRMIDDCADLGIEVYHVDAGWFKDVGDWHSNPNKFPNGLETIADYTHSKGLKFGLWVGWTQGGSLKDRGPDVLSPFSPDQKDWFGQYMPDDWKNAQFAGATVCLGCAGARNWCLNDLRRMVKQYKLDLLEHDQNMVLATCYREGHDHIPGDRADVSRAAAEGYYGVYDQLRKENPNLLLEDCVNGGRLFDFGVAKRVHYICMSDDYDPLNLRRNFYDSSYPFPPSMLEAYIADHRGQTLANFRYMLRSAMLGWCTIMMDMSKWTPEQRVAGRREFKMYKERLRPLIASANLYHILPRPDGANWDGSLYATNSGGVLYVFRPQSDRETQTIRLRGLNPKKTYRIEAVDGSASGKYTGAQLMSAGLTVRLPERNSSDLIFVNVYK